MFRVELFSAASVALLKQAITPWLQAHKEVSVVHSNITTQCIANEKEYIFYLLYTTPNGEAEALMELAKEVQPQHSVEAAQINPEVLKPTS